LLRCDAVYQRVYYENQLTTLAPTTLTPPLCILHRRSALNIIELDLHMMIPECDEQTGLYLPIQCDRQHKWCWCVNVQNGVELYGSRVYDKNPIC
jgi:hypothetical protein